MLALKASGRLAKLRLRISFEWGRSAAGVADTTGEFALNSKIPMACLYRNFLCSVPALAGRNAGGCYSAEALR